MFRRGLEEFTNNLKDKFMKIQQKVQALAAAAVLVGAGSLGLMSPRVALADSCSAENGEKCLFPGYCPSNGIAGCAFYAPAGCTVASAICTPNVCNTAGYYYAYCTFKAS